MLRIGEIKILIQLIVALPSPPGVFMLHLYSPESKSLGCNKKENKYFI
jgi:hypothetical protein